MRGTKKLEKETAAKYLKVLTQETDRTCTGVDCTEDFHRRRPAGTAATIIHMYFKTRTVELTL